MLKPNFSHHWGNYLLVLMAFLCGFLPAAFVLAETIHNTVSHQMHRYVQLPGETLNDLKLRIANACGEVSSNRPSNYETTSANCYGYAGFVLDDEGRDAWSDYSTKKYQFNESTGQNDVIYSWYRVWYYAYSSGACPEGYGDADGDGVCNRECPAAGTLFNGTFTEPLGAGPLIVTVGGPRNADGCEVVPVFKTVRCDTASKLPPSQSCERIVEYQYTGEETGVQEAPGEGMEGVEPVPEGESTEPTPEGDYTFDEKTETPMTPTSETMPDGTTVDQTGGTTTETKDKGLKIDEKPETTTVEWSEGITKTESWTETCTTQPDGSKSCEWTRHLSYEQTDKDLMIVKNDDGTTTITTVPGYSGSSDTTKTTDYDSNGNPTGTSETTTYSGDEEGKEEARGEGSEEGCDANPLTDECIGEFDEGDGNSHSFDGDKGENSYTTAVGKYQDLIDQIQDDMDDVFTPVDGGGSIDSYMVTIRGQSADIGLTKWIPYFDSFNLAALVMAMAALIAFIIVMGVR